jgi:AcrR family transcriptional regulator
MKTERTTRTYKMGARAEAAAATAERILDATVEVFMEQPSDQIRIEEVARRAGVTVQTVIRRFGRKEGLFTAAATREADRVRDMRFAVTPGNVSEAVSNLVEHYEEYGDGAMRMLSEEERIPAIKTIVDNGRAVHREWCIYAFQPFLSGLAAADRNLRIAQLVAVCDVYTWYLLRRQSGLSRQDTELALIEMLAPFTKEDH